VSILTIIPFLLQGASLGLTASISPGPLLLYLISQSLSGGWKRGVIVAIAPLVSDIPLIIVILVVLDHVPPLLLRLISIVGGIYVIYLAWNLFQSWRQNRSVNLDEKSEFRHNLGRAILVNYLSPGPYMFWTLVNGPLLLQALHISIMHGILFLISFYAMFVGSMIALVSIFSQAQRFGQRIVRTLSLLSVIILSIIGVILIYRGFHGI
jgi:threonine/homoserine/homoserine lactone efflux protein